MPRTWVWFQVLLGWLPVWALYTALIVTQHPPITTVHAGALAARAVVPAALLGMLVFRLVKRVPWPRRFSVRFVLLHLAAAPAYAVAWILSSSLVESALHRRMVVTVGPGVLPFLVLGIWLYLIVAGLSYAIEGTDRAVRAEAATARMQLAALRAQLHPHFLFNALHTVVQLIPTEPAHAAEAAEQVASLLRTTVEEDRDLVSLRDEWSFVSRYLELERLRFGERLRVHARIDAGLLDEAVPSFALQTLVENAVRHGAAPRVQPTEITVSAAASPGGLTLRVHDTGDGTDAARRGDVDGRAGTGLFRLRDRLAALYGGGARLELVSAPSHGFEATRFIPRAGEA